MSSHLPTSPYMPLIKAVLSSVLLQFIPGQFTNNLCNRIHPLHTFINSANFPGYPGPKILVFSGLEAMCSLLACYLWLFCILAPVQSFTNVSKAIAPKGLVAGKYRYKSLPDMRASWKGWYWRPVLSQKLSFFSAVSAFSFST